MVKELSIHVNFNFIISTSLQAIYIKLLIFIKLYNSYSTRHYVSWEDIKITKLIYKEVISYFMRNCQNNNTTKVSVKCKGYFYI